MEMTSEMPRACWMVVDYEERFIILRVGKEYEDGHCTDDHIVPTTGFDASYAAWDAFHEDWQYGPCPFAYVPVQYVKVVD